MYKILIILPKLTTQGGVSAYWNSMLPILKTYENLDISILEIGGNGKNLFGPFLDQYKVYIELKKNYDLVFINPSLGKKSFFRDALFAKQITKSKTKFLSFFHGWDKVFEKTITKKYQQFFLNSFGKSENIFVLSKDFKETILNWGYTKKIIIETTSIDASLIENFSLENKILLLRESQKIKILFLARIFKEKGIYELIDAFINISKKIDNLELIIAGSGEIQNDLKEFTSEYKNIIYTGHVEGKEKVTLFTNSHMYCLPSYSEGLPTSVLEAMAFALPVITTPVGGLKEFFLNEKMGYLVTPKNIKEIENKLKILINNKEKVIEIGKYNNEYANEKLLNTVVAKRIYGYIQEVING